MCAESLPPAGSRHVGHPKAFFGMKARPRARESSKKCCGKPWKSPRITLRRATPRYLASTLTPPLRVPQNSGLHYAAGGAKNIMPTHKDSSKNRKKPRRKRETKTLRVSARVTPSLYQQIEAIAVEEDRSVASVARLLISTGLRARPRIEEW